MVTVVMEGWERWSTGGYSIFIMEKALRVWERKILRKGTHMDGEFVQTRNYKINIEVLI
jgi:hypothetical protein